MRERREARCDAKSCGATLPAPNGRAALRSRKKRNENGRRGTRTGSKTAWTSPQLLKQTDAAKLLLPADLRISANRRIDTRRKSTKRRQRQGNGILKKADAAVGGPAKKLRKTRQLRSRVRRARGFCAPGCFDVILSQMRLLPGGASAAPGGAALRDSRSRRVL